MRLKKIGGILEPFDELDRVLFVHITKGRTGITDEYLHEHKDIFIAHGVYAVEINGEVVEL